MDQLCFNFLIAIVYMYFTNLLIYLMLIIGIASLYKYGQSGVNPGDMLFLMRNLATNCSGLHRIAARCGFTKVSVVMFLQGCRLQRCLKFSIKCLLMYLNCVKFSFAVVQAMGSRAPQTAPGRRH